VFDSVDIKGKEKNKENEGEKLIDGISKNLFYFMEKENKSEEDIRKLKKVKKFMDKMKEIGGTEVFNKYL